MKRVLITIIMIILCIIINTNATLATSMLGDIWNAVVQKNNISTGVNQVSNAMQSTNQEETPWYEAIAKGLGSVIVIITNVMLIFILAMMIIKGAEAIILAAQGKGTPDYFKKMRAEIYFFIKLAIVTLVVRYGLPVFVMAIYNIVIYFFETLKTL